MISIVAVIIAGFSLLESHKRSELTKSIAESLEYIAAKPKRKKASDTQTEKRKLALQEKAEERRRLQAQLKEQQVKFQRQKELAKALGWLYDRVTDDDFDEG